MSDPLCKHCNQPHSQHYYRRGNLLSTGHAMAHPIAWCPISTSFEPKPEPKAKPGVRYRFIGTGPSCWGDRIGAADGRLASTDRESTTVDYWLMSSDWVEIPLE